MCKCVPADPKCQYFIRNMCKCVRDINYSKMLIFHLKYVQMRSGFEICANLLWVPHGSLYGSYMDLMWGRSGPSMDPYKDLIWMLMSGSSGPARLGGDGTLCSSTRAGVCFT